MDNEKRVLQCCSDKDMEDIIVANQGLIYKQLYRLNLSYDSEAYSHGLIGLYKAILTYTDTTKSAFSTYASVCIYNNICGYLRKKNNVIDRSSISYDATLSDGESTLLEYLEDPKRVEDDYFSKVGVSYIKKFAKKYYDDETNENRRKILKLWYEHTFAISNKDIAKTVGCSTSYVSKVVVQFRKDLKAYLKEVYRK